MDLFDAFRTKKGVLRPRKYRYIIEKTLTLVHKPRKPVYSMKKSISVDVFSIDKYNIRQQPLKIKTKSQCWIICLINLLSFEVCTWVLISPWRQCPFSSQLQQNSVIFLCFATKCRISFSHLVVHCIACACVSSKSSRLYFMGAI